MTLAVKPHLLEQAQRLEYQLLHMVHRIHPVQSRNVSLSRKFAGGPDRTRRSPLLGIQGQHGVQRDRPSLIGFRYQVVCQNVIFSHLPIVSWTARTQAPEPNSTISPHPSCPWTGKTVSKLIQSIVSPLRRMPYQGVLLVEPIGLLITSKK